MSVVPVCIYTTYTTYVSYVCGGQERKSDFLELELWMAVEHHAFHNVCQKKCYQYQRSFSLRLVYCDSKCLIF